MAKCREQHRHQLCRAQGGLVQRRRACGWIPPRKQQPDEWELGSRCSSFSSRVRAGLELLCGAYRHSEDEREAIARAAGLVAVRHPSTPFFIESISFVSRLSPCPASLAAALGSSWASAPAVPCCPAASWWAASRPRLAAFPVAVAASIAASTALVASVTPAPVSTVATVATITAVTTSLNWRWPHKRKVHRQCLVQQFCVVGAVNGCPCLLQCRVLNQTVALESRNHVSYNPITL